MRRPTKFRPRIQALDDRALPAATLSNGLLEVVGTTGADLIRVTLADPGTLHVTDSGTGEDNTFELSAVSNILVRSRAGDDTVVIGPKITIPAEVRAWSGNDTIRGGGGNDTLLGGGGDDTIDGRFGDNRIDGGEGNNTLRAGAGADQIRSTLGTNTLYGTQNTTFYGVKDTDTVADAGGSPTFLGDTANPLQPVTSVDQLRDWVVQNSVADWAGWFGQPATPVAPGTLDGGVAPSGGGGGGGATDGGTPVSGTNTQVAGVDEADTVKTDGRYIYTVSNGHLLVVDARDPAQLALVGDLDVGHQSGRSVQGFYLMGDRAVVLSQTYQFDAPTMYPTGIDPLTAGISMCWPAFYKTQTVVTTVDISDPTAPTVTHEATLDGTLYDSRVVNGRLYAVLSNSLYFPQPLLTDTPDGQVYESEAAYKTRLDSSLTDSLPGYTTTDFTAGGTVTGSGSLVDGASLYLPDTTDGQNLLTVAAFDPAADAADPVGVTTIAGSSGVVYASASNLYVAATDYVSPWDNGPTTQIYKFALDGDSVPLDAVGTVTGTVLDQFSMDEQNGYFRIATGSVTMSATDEATLSNAVYVMADVGGKLNVVGAINDLSPGEAIQSVRFDGDAGYVTTFLQTDPLFTLDLSDPTAPAVAGELVIPGYSTYLQSLGNGLVLGVGRDADPATGAVGGLQLSLFDVSDPANPKQLDVFSFSSDSWGGWSDAEWDHHAFSWFPDVGVLALPVTVDWEHPGALEVLHVGADGIEQLGEVAHADSPVTRSLRIGDVLFSVSAGEVQANNLTDPSVRVGGVQLPAPEVVDPPPVDGGPIIFATGGTAAA
jgi:uncharacterized secreted protein with C-terminal beta-propeller domain